MALDAKQVDKPFKKLRKVLKKVNGSIAPDLVHDLRTNARKIEAVFTALPVDGRKLLKKVSAVRRCSGHVRDMDVLTADAATLISGGEKQCAVQLLEYLGKTRYREAQRLKRVVRKSAQQLRRDLRKSVAELDEALAPEIASDANVHAMDTVLQQTLELREPRRLTRDNIHEYRLKVKQLRYMLQMADDGNRDESFINALGNVKDVIGEWHDWQQLAGIADQVLDHSNCELKRQIAEKADLELERALQITNQMRAQYLHSVSREEPHRKVPRAAGSRKVPNQALKIVSSLAA